MCGISGWFDPSGGSAVDRALIRAINNEIAHRGPDGDGFYFAPGVALAHRRLAIIDLAGGAQPMCSQGGKVVIVFNGEIYNFRELRAELEAKGLRFLTRSDTEVILAAWEVWGVECVEKMNGMFAFALWDARQHALFLARDRLGEKPLYLARLRDGTLLFGSELKALMAHPKVDRRIDHCAVEEFFSYGYIPDPRTIYKGVERLEAGTALMWRRGEEARRIRYWKPVCRDVPLRSLEEAAEAVRGELAASVRAQRVADVPLGSFLSGGVDSAGVTALAASSEASPLDCFTIGFSDPRFDERGYAAGVAARYGAHQHTLVLQGDEEQGISALPEIFDEPFGDSSALPTLQLARLARAHVKVALSGDGGDELFAGYRRYMFHGREEALRSHIPEPVRRMLFGSLARIYPQLDWAPRFLRFRQTFRELSCGTAEGFFHNVCVTSDDKRQELFSPALRQELDGYHAREVVGRHLKEAPFDDAIARAQYADLKTWLVGDILVKVDRTAMSCGLEVRVPMLSASLVELALNLPRAFKLAGGEGKRVLKRAFEPLLPHSLLYRRKQGFSVPLADWFRGQLGHSFEREWANSEGMDEFFMPETVSQLISDHRRGLADNSRTLWLIWMFQGFLRRHHSVSAAKDAVAAE